MTRILLVEDDAALREATVEMLDAEGYEVVDAADGQAGVQAARTFVPELVICDIMMPIMDGYAVLDALRHDPVTATIPFLFLTAKADRGDQRRGMELGADDYLTKPFTRDELLGAIETRRTRFASVAQPMQRKIEDLRRVVARTVPHELRTPLTGILGFASLLKESQDPLNGDEVREWAGLILAAGERLSHLIEKHLLYANIEVLQQAPELLENEQTDFTPEAGAVIAIVAQLAVQEAGRDADLHMTAITGAARVCEDHLSLMTKELMDNACKFSPAGSPITVSGGVDDSKFRLSVSDCGHGMTAEQIAAVSAYTQFDRRQYEQQGTGIGLAMVRGLARIHAGELIIRSVLGEGTTAQITLPAAPCAHFTSGARVSP
jgi:signal transduction histidine kinase